MVSCSKTVPGLLYQSDDTIATWANAGGWSEADEPSGSIFDHSPISLLGPGDGHEREGVREFAVNYEGPDWYYFYSGGDGVRGWRISMAVSRDRGLTRTRLGVISSGLSKVTSGEWKAVDLGIVQYRTVGGVGKYYMHRVTTPRTYPDNDPGNLNVGLPGGPYGWDIWEADDIRGPWTPVRDVSLEPGTWCTTQKVCSSIVKVGATYYAFATGDTDNGLCTSSTPGGDYTSLNATAELSTTPSGMGGYAFENPEHFYHPWLGRWVCLGNSYLPGSGGWASRTAIGVSADATIGNWVGAKWSNLQRVGPMDSSKAIGILRRFVGHEDEFLYDTATGIVPVTYDGNATRYGPNYLGAWNFGREILVAALEPSLKALRYTGSGDATSRALSRTLVHGDIVVELAAYLGAANGAGGSLTVEYRSNGAGDAYRARIASDGVWSLLKVVGGVETTLATGAGDELFDVTGMQHRLKVSVIGDVHTLRINGEAQVSHTDGSSPHTSGTSIAMAGKGIDVDVRRLSARKSDIVIVTGMTAGTSANVRGYGGAPWGSLVADASGVALYTNPHYPLPIIELGGVDYRPIGDIWGGDTLTFTGLPSVSPPTPGGLT